MQLNRFVSAAAASAAIVVSAPAQAQITLEGNFIASKACPAFQSIRKQTNPGGAMVKPGRAYRLFGKNNEPASHYLIEVPGVSPDHRWVAVGCGQFVVAGDGGGEGNDNAGGTTPPTRDKPEYVLAFSWQPAFCETRPNKPECESQTDARFDATHFALHGLWPQPRDNVYCNVTPNQVSLDKASRWGDLDPIVLDDSTATELAKVMPGAQSNLHLHEWVKHGTCYNNETADEYYRDSLALMASINASPAQKLFADNIGGEVRTADLKAAFNEAFGAGAGDRLRVACKRDGGRNLIVEITLGLAGTVGEDPEMSALIAASPATDSGCPGGLVDPVGLQ